MIIKKFNEINSASKKYKIYLAGPDVFRKNAIKSLSELKRVAKRYGHEGLAPLDNILEIEEDQKFTPKHATMIFDANVQLIEDCDVIIANIEPFRGPSVDDGTAWEIGYGFAKNKIIYGYSELSDKSLEEITKMMFDMSKQKKYTEIEKMGHSTNLMIVDSIKASGGKVFKTFEECLIHLSGR